MEFIDWQAIEYRVWKMQIDALNILHEHEVRIEHDERFLARPFGILCKCGFRGAAVDQQEAERVKARHLEQAGERRGI